VTVCAVYMHCACTVEERDHRAVITNHSYTHCLVYWVKCLLFYECQLRLALRDVNEQNKCTVENLTKF